MKIVGYFSMFVLFFVSHASAMPVGSPELLPDSEEYAVAVIDSYTFDRSLEAANTRDEKIESANHLYLRFTRHLSPFFDLYGNIGVSNLTARERFIENGVLLREEYGYGIFGGGGGKFAAELHPNSGWWAGLDIQSNWARMPIRNVERNSESSTTQSGRSRVRDIQISTLISKRIKFEYASDWPDAILIPFGGVKLSWYDFKTKITYQVPSGLRTLSGPLENKDKVGFIGGFALDWKRRMQFQVEGAVFDDFSLSASCHWAF